MNSNNFCVSSNSSSEKIFFEFKFEFGRNDRVQRARVRSPATFTFHSQRVKTSFSEYLVESKKKRLSRPQKPNFSPKIK